MPFVCFAVDGRTFDNTGKQLSYKFMEVSVFPTSIKSEEILYEDMQQAFDMCVYASRGAGRVRV